MRKTNDTTGFILEKLKSYCKDSEKVIKNTLSFLILSLVVRIMKETMNLVHVIQQRHPFIFRTQ